MFQLYPTSLPCHSSRHVENLQGISCCFQNEALAITSTIFHSVASSRVFKACFVHSQGPLSRTSSAKITELKTSYCSISRIARTKAFINHAGLPLRVAMNWSRSSLCTPAVHYIVSWPPSISIWSYSHPIVSCCRLLLRPVLHTVCKCASWAIFLVAVIAVSHWTNWCLCCSCVSARGSLDEAPCVWLDSDLITPGWGVCGAMTCYCGKGEEDDSEKWKVLSNI